MTETKDPSSHVARNRRAWDSWAQQFAEPGRKSWAHSEPTWGIWDIPESQVHILPDNVRGLDTVELGCGTAYVSAWVSRLGANVIGLDNSRQQLKTAKALQNEYNLQFPLVFGNAEHSPFPNESFDLIISEYGASLWCDPYNWIPEASRILRPDGRLIFLQNSMILILCANQDGRIPAGRELQRDLFGMHKFEFSDSNGSIEFHLGHGDWIRLLRKNGFEIENLVELRPSEGPEVSRWTFVTREWAHHWPAEEAWIARKRQQPRKNVKSAS